MNKRVFQVFGFVAFVLAAQGCVKNETPAVISETSANSALFQRKNLIARQLGPLPPKTLILTFDDGPTRGVTNLVLDYLAQEGIHANFFLVGEHIDGNEDLLERMRDEGHGIGNHTWDHRMLVPMSRTSINSVYNEIAATDEKITPFERPNANFYFRAPGGAFNPRGSNATSDAMNSHPDLKKYIGPIYWDIGGEIIFLNADGSRSLDNEPTPYIGAAADWDCWRRNYPVESCAAAYLSETDHLQGGIVLMHDHNDASAADSRSYEMLKILVPEWKKRGYKFMTLDEIPGIENLRSTIRR